MSKQFNEWNSLKQKLHSGKKENFFKQRDVSWVSVGVNVGFEQDGKGEIFSRPVLILKTYNQHIFLGIPLSTQIKQGSFFFEFALNNKPSNALLVQARVHDAKRLENKIGKISQENFKKLKYKFMELVNV